MVLGIACKKDLTDPIEEDQISNHSRTSMSISDTSGWELDHVYDLMRNMDRDNLIQFLSDFGYPAWEHSIHKRADEINITSIPMMIGDSITGILKVFVTVDDDVEVEFFSRADIDERMTENLSSQDYHVYRGAIQSLILCTEHSLGDTADVKYWDWLVEHQDRNTERLGYYCNYVLDCSWRYFPFFALKGRTGGSVQPSGSSIRDGEWRYICEILNVECWIGGPNGRVFPNTTGTYPGSGRNTNPNDKSGRNRETMRGQYESWLTNCGLYLMV